MEALRNHAQHRGLPIQRVDFRATLARPEDPVPGTRFSVVPLLNVIELERDENSPLARSIAAMQAARVRWTRTAAEERRAWAYYMLQHQPRFWDGRTLPRKPVRERAPVSVGVSLVEPPARSAPERREPVPSPTPVIVIPQPVREPPMAKPGLRFRI